MTSPSVSMIAPSSSPATSLSGSSGNPDAVSGQFFGFLKFLENSNAANAASGATQPAFANGMHARFQALSSNDTNFQDLMNRIGKAGLPQNVLLALTTGVPSEFLPEGTESNNGVTALTLDQLSELVSSHSDALTNGNILLVAANVAPEDMEQVAKSLTDALDKFQKLQHSPTVSPTTGPAPADDANDTDISSNPVHLVLVTLVPASSGENAIESSVTEGVALSSDDVSGIEDASQPDVNVNWVAFANILSEIYRPKSLGAASGDSLTVDGAAASVDASAQDSTSPFDKKPLSPAEVAALTAKEGSSAEGQAYKAASADGADKAPSSGGSLKFNDAAPNSASVRFLDQSKDWGSGAKIGFDLSGLALPSTSASSATPAALSNPLLTNSSAAAAHPAAQAVSALLERTMKNGEVKTQTLSVELDPPELGRVQIHLSYEKGEPMKVHLLTEREDTLAILKRDSHALRQALDMAGIKTDGSSLNFDMSHDSNAFQQAMAQQQNNGEGSSSFRLGTGGMAEAGSVSAGSQVIETALGIMIDEATGQVRYNLLA